MSAGAKGVAAGPGGSALELRGVEKSFGATQIIRGVSLDVRRGERLRTVGSMPALSTVSQSDARPSAVARSHGLKTTRSAGLASRRREATASSNSPLRAASTSEAAFGASWPANSAPSPEDAPVTIA